MMLLRSMTLLIALAIALSPVAAQQTDCSSIGLPVDDLSDGQTFVRVTSGWQPFTGFSDLSISTPGRVQMVYAVREQSGRERTGVIIVKSGRTPATRHADKRVALVRRDAKKQGACKQPDAFDDAAVSGDVYDGFHDFGRNKYPKEALGTLHRFHIEFGTNCRRTDYDPGGLYRHVSNRASFSYLEDVVDNGGYTGLEAALRNFRLTGTAEAENPSLYGDRRTEIKQYATSQGVACIAITVPVSDRGTFLRINDLAGKIINGKRERRF